MTSSALPENGSSTGRLELLVLAFCGLHSLFLFLWVVALLSGDADNQRDWYHLWTVGKQVATGDLTHIYSVDSLESAAADAQYFWRYPPFALYLVWPLSWLGEHAAYAVLVSIELVAMVGALWLLFRTEGTVPAAPAWAVAVLCSAPALSTLILGQSSGLLLLVVVVAAWLWRHDRPLLACALLGVLAFKPNWGLFFGLYALGSREWRGAGVMAAVVAGLCLVSLPLGTHLWTDFLGSALSNGEVLVEYEAFKQITLKGFLAAVVPGQAVATWIWAGCALALLGLTCWIWQRLRALERGVHGLGIAVVLAVALNPYGSFYDALILAFPATLWWTSRRLYMPAIWRGIGLCIAVIWIWEHFSMYYSGLFESAGWPVTAPFSLIGPLSVLWLIGEGISLAKTRPLDSEERRPL